MVRYVLGSLCVLALSVVLVTAADKDKADNKDKEKASKNDKGHKEAKISKMDAKKGTLMVTMKDNSGKEVKRTFRLARNVRYLDSTGKVIAVDVFRSGDDVLILQAKGEIVEVKKKDSKDKDKKDKKSDKDK